MAGEADIGAVDMRLTKSRWIWIVLVVVIGLPLAGLLFVWFGVYNVAASRGHWEITDQFLRLGMERAVKVRAPDMPTPPALDDPDLIRLGAGHFQGGCAYCHGAPGQPINPISRQMLPPPPDLSDRVTEWSAKELFWIVKHGIKYAGMPAWPAQQRDDEVWAVVAFLRKLPELNAQAYRSLALAQFELAPSNGRLLAVRDSTVDGDGACARCHGAEGIRPSSALVPMLHGQPSEMLLAALQAYADGNRASGIMEPIAWDLTPEARQKLGEYYSSLPVPAAFATPDKSAETADLGHRIATEGLLSEQIPPCQSCHGENALPRYPRLAGQSERYLANQLRLFKAGVRDGTEAAKLMTTFAERLSDAQIEAAAAHYARVTTDTAPTN